MNEHSLQHALDACRPGSSDLSLPEFAELASRVSTDAQVRRAYEATQAFDAALGESFQDVHVPSGLAARLLAAANSAASETQPAKPGVVLSPRRASAWSQSYELIAATTLIAICAAAVLAVALFTAPAPLTPEQLVDRSFEWKEQLNHDAWTEGLKSAPREEFPLGSRAAIGPWRWQRVSTSQTDMVVYYGGPPDVYLFVVRSPTRVSGLSSSPSLLSATGGWSVGAWQSGDLTYVLVVEGDKRRYESHLKSHTPV